MTHSMHVDSAIAARRLSAQFELSRVLAEAADVASAAPRILDAVGRNLECAVAELWVVDPGEQVIACVATWTTDGGESPFVHRGYRFGRGEGLPGQVWERGTPLWIGDVGSEASFQRRSEAARLGLHTALAFPIQFAGRTTGVVQFFDRRARERDAALLETFADVGSQVGLFLERIRMADTVVRQAREIVALSTPVLEVAERVLVAPLIGTLDAKRADQCMSRILERTVAVRARVVLVDVTGVPDADTFVAGFLLDTMRATSLLGSRVLLTGVRPALASTMTRLGVPLEEIQAFATLADGLREALAATRSG